jgi:uncharacterized ion transporter superfamily protein YfcC
MAETIAPDDTADTSADAENKVFKFPTALTVLAIVLVVVFIASFFIPSGLYQLDESGAPIPGSYERLPDCGDQAEEVAGLCSDKSIGAQFGLLWRATPNGLYGIEGVDSRIVGADELGFLYGSAQIFLFVLAVGAFITMTMKTGAIEAGINRLAMRFGKSPIVLVVVLMGVFAVGGTTYGMWEETLGFYAVMVPLVVALGYDRMVAVAIIALGAGTGTLASTVNPFATGVASDAAGISISDGIGLRLVMWLVLVPIAMAYVIWYGNRVRNDPAKSYVPTHRADLAAMASPSEKRRETGDAAGSPSGGSGAATAVAAPDVVDVPPLTGKQKGVITIFLLTFGIMIYGFIPWDDVWDTLFDTEFFLYTFDNFYFTEASMLFIVAAVIIGVVARFKEADLVGTIVSGAADFLGAALVIVLARGITVVMKNTFITDTILNSMETIVDGLSGTSFAIIAWIVNIPIGFLVPSSSGHAALVMPLLAPLAGFAGVEPQVTVTAFQSASGWVNLITPTSAVLMGGLTIAKVGYDKFLKFVLPYMAILFVAVTIFMAIAAI